MPKFTNATPSSSTRKPVSPTKRKATKRKAAPRKKPVKEAQPDSEQPTLEEWQLMQPWGSCGIVMADGAGVCEFRVKDDILILPTGCKPDEAPTKEDADLWVGRIVELRARHEHDVWARVRWFWSPRDKMIKIPKKRFDPGNCAKMELLLSFDAPDFVSYKSFIAVLQVELFDESATNNDPIGPDTFFARYLYSHDLKTIKPIKDRVKLCLCGKPYNPDAAVASPSTSTMHFCPNQTCLQAYHRSCLLKHDWIMSPSPSNEIPTIYSRQFRLLSAIPPLNEEEADLIQVESSLMKPQSRQRRLTDRHIRLDSLPPGLVNLAGQPLVMPLLNRNPSSSIKDLAGNVTLVIKARRLVQAAINGQIKAIEHWEELLGVTSEEDIESCLVDNDMNVPQVVCPACSEPI